MDSSTTTFVDPPVGTVPAPAVVSCNPSFDRLRRLPGDRLQVGGLAVEDLAARFGTPLYIVDGAALAGQLVRVRAALAPAGVRLHYSIKANPSLAVLRRCLATGYDLDVCSPGDVHLALEAGARCDQLSYTGVALCDEDIDRLRQLGVRVNLDSLSEIVRWSRIAQGTAVGVRLAPGITAGFHPHCRSGDWGGKFGVDLGDIEAASRTLATGGCRLARLHVHLGSSITTEEPFLTAFDVLLGLCDRLPDVEAINLGGGLAAPYHPEDPEFPLATLGLGLVERIDAFQRRTGRRMVVELEPGELLISEAVYLVTSVRVMKTWRRPDTTRRVAIVDASMNLLPAHSLYGTYFHIAVDGKPADASRGSVEYDVYGCTNQAGDRLASGRLLPVLDESDLLVFRNAGAYGFSRSTRFNERPRPGELWVEEGRAHLARQAETFADLTGGELGSAP